MSLSCKQIVARILIVVFAFFYANICFFYHGHIINGVTIVHSHFHDKAHTNSGTHSQSELTLISALSLLQSFQASLGFVGLGIFLFLQAIILPSFVKATTRRLISSVSLRAPPSSFLC